MDRWLAAMPSCKDTLYCFVFSCCAHIYLSVGSYPSGIPGSGVSKYFMAGKTTSQVNEMPESQQTLTDTSVEFDGQQTVMKFTKIMDEPGEVPIVVGDNTFLWAYGSSPTLAYHANRNAFALDLSSGSDSSGMDDAATIAVGDEVCITGYMMDQCAYIMLSACSRRMHFDSNLRSTS